MKYLHVSSYAPPHGGASRVMAEQAEAQRVCFNDDVAVVSLEPGFNSLEKVGVKVTQLRGISIKQDWLLTPKDLMVLWKLVAGVDVIILHSPYYVINCVAALFGRMLKKQVVCIHHGHLPSEFRNKLNISYMNMMVRKWLILDDGHKDYLKKYVKKLKPVLKIENGIWLDKLAPLRVTKKSTKANFVYCGRVVWDKGSRELATVVERNPNLSFFIIGDGIDLDFFSSLKNAKTFGFLDHDAALAEIAKADYLILPSYHETFPLVIVEALALNVPVIVSNLNDTIAQLVDGNGLLIVPESVDSLNEAVQRAISEHITVTRPQAVEALDWPIVIQKIRAALTIES